MKERAFCLHFILCHAYLHHLCCIRISICTCLSTHHIIHEYIFYVCFLLKAFTVLKRFTIVSFLRISCTFIYIYKTVLICSNMTAVINNHLQLTFSKKLWGKEKAKMQNLQQKAKENPPLLPLWLCLDQGP